jgi:hypothetical protein
MKTFSLRPLIFFAPILLLSSVHGGVDPTIIPADSLWVIYADFNALRASTLGKQLVTLVEQSKFDTGQGDIGLDMQKVLATVGTVTAYGANFSQDPKAIDGALVAQGSADLRKIIESVLIQANLAHPENVVEVKDLPFTAYAIRPHDPKSTNPMELIIAFPPEPIVIASKSRAQLLRARDTYRHTAASVATTADAPLKDLLSRSTDSYLYSASVVPSDTLFRGDQPQARILRMTKSGAIAVGENGPNTFAHAELIAASDDMADKLMKILQGMTAMMSLAETNDKQLADFLSSSRVTRDNNTVTLQLAYSSDRLVQMIKTLADQSPSLTPEQRRVIQTPQLINGRALAQWQAATAANGTKESPIAWRTIENVSLNNGALISLGRFANGGRNARFDRIEFVPVGGNSAPLVFRTEFMSRGGPRGNLLQFQFPGIDGTYTIKVAYLNDPDGKALYAVSVRDAAPTQQPGAN